MVVGGDDAEADESAGASPRCDTAASGPGVVADRGAFSLSDDVLAELSEELAEAGIKDDQAAAEHQQRLAADEDLVAELAADNFAGVFYEKFTDRLTNYSLGVLPVLILSGRMFQRCAARGFDVKPSDEEIAALRSDADTRMGLACGTVANALPWFRDHALVKGGWKAAGGACLTTYFIGACDFFFPNELRAWRREREFAQHLLRDGQDLMLIAGADRRTPSPEATAVGNLWVHQRIAGSDDQVRKILFLKSHGYQHAEIVEALGGTLSVRAVEGVLHRWRKKEQIKLRRDESHERQ